jgi:hypothetical protein
MTKRKNAFKCGSVTRIVTKVRTTQRNNNNSSSTTTTNNISNNNNSFFVFLPLCAPRRLCPLHFDRVRHKVFPLSPLPRRDQSKRSWRRQTIHRLAETFILRAFVTLNQGFSNFICWRPPYLFLEILQPFKVSCNPLDIKISHKSASIW